MTYTATFTAKTADDMKGFLAGASLKFASSKIVSRDRRTVKALWISEGEHIDLHNEVVARDLEIYNIAHVFH